MKIASALFSFLIISLLPWQFASVHAGEIEVPNGSFEKTRAAKAPDSGFAPVGWEFTTWSLAREKAPEHGIDDEGAALGKQSIFVGATTEGSAGWSSGTFPLSPDCETLTLRVKVKKSSDYTGGTPWIFLTWNKNGGAFLGKTEAKTNGGEAGQWTEVTLTVTRDEIPAGTENFRINLAVLGVSTGSAAGRVAFDDVRLNEDAEKKRETKFTLRGDALYSWWKLGDPVHFAVASGKVPDWIESLTGKVVDSLGATVAEETVEREKFVKDGWTWKPAEPGFYEVLFSYREKGEAKPKTLKEPWQVKSKVDPKKMHTILRERYTVAVAAGGPRPAKERPPQFGFHCERADEDAIAANLVGFSFVRFWFTWGGNGWEWADKLSAELLLEPERGKFQWAKYDEFISLFQKNGFDVHAVIVNTPKWASSHPEDTKVDICVPGYAAYAPKDMADWSNAVRAVVTHYKSDIKIWELWNEPHLPGFSVFWKDTPEKFVELLKSGYETVKSIQPDSTVIIGGMAHRYLPFYRELLRLGGGAYFDRLGIHGQMQIPDDFYVLDKKFGVKSKLWANTECHSILLDSLGFKGKTPTENELALRMLYDHFLQFKHGVQDTAFFCMINNSNKFEMEVIPISREEKSNIQPAALFRKFPQIEPRLAAVVMRTFLDHVNGKLVYRGEFELPNEQKAVWFETGGKQLVAVWSASEQAVPLDPNLKKVITPDSHLIDWEGRTLNASSLQVQPNRAYWIANANLEALKALPATDNLILSKEERERRMKKDHTGPTGIYQNQPLFATPQEPLLNETAIHWNDSSWKAVGQNGKTLPTGYSARFAVACQKDGLDLVVDVSGDPKFYQESKRGEYWDGDCVQFAIDTEENGMPPGIMEFAVALTKDGPVLWKTTAPSLGGDLPAKWTAANQLVKFGSAAVEKLADGRLRYKARLDWAELYPLVWKGDKTLFFSLLANDNDGAGRVGWVEWSSGIGSDKDPSLYGKLSPAK